MIEYIKGDIAEITPATVVLDCNGMGYGINISLNTYSAIQNQSNTKLYIYEAIREDAYVLYGFSTKQERELFLLLISVSGIGGNTARMILSALSPSELCGVISSGNDKLLKTVKGIGLKTAQRIIVDLKDKIATSGVETVNSEMFANPGNTEIHDEAVAALTMLGFAQAASQKVVAAILKEEPAAPVEKVIKLALKRLKGLYMKQGTRTMRTLGNLFKIRFVCVPIYITSLPPVPAFCGLQTLFSSSLLSYLYGFVPCRTGCAPTPSILQSPYGHWVA